MQKLSDMLRYTPGNHGLTEEIIYLNKPLSVEDSIPVFSGSRNNEEPIGYVRRWANNNAGKALTIFHGPCLILTKDGSAGLLTFRAADDGPFTINHHACVLTLREAWKDRVNLKWFAYQYQDLFFRVATSKSGNRVFSIDWLNKLRVSIPDVERQNRQCKKKDQLLGLRRELASLRARAGLLLRRPVSNPDEGSIFNGAMSQVFRVHGGNAGLTEELMYNNLPISESKPVEVLTGATLDRNKMGQISSTTMLPSGKVIKIVDGQFILLTRKGFYAGTMLYVGGNKRFAINDDAYALELKTPWHDKVNLKWFVYRYSALVRSTVTARHDNATFNKDWLAKLCVELPSRDYQDALMDKVERMQTVSRQASALEERLRKLIDMPVEIDAAADRSEVASYQE